jgi:DNA polymerase III subunit epsilon
MRQIFLDTETTGLYTAQGHRIIEIAAVESLNRRVTDRHFHVYLNPEREIDEAAIEVHGITLDFLQDKPKFEDVVNDFLDFVSGAELIIHNAPFDVGFLNAEMGRIGRDSIESQVALVTDTYKIAKELRPGQRNNLDALCRHYGIDNSSRTLHGALLDAELLAEVYFAMTRGQDSLMIDLDDEPKTIQEVSMILGEEHPLVVLAASEDELTEHDAYLNNLNKGENVWKRLS